MDLLKGEKDLYLFKSMYIKKIGKEVLYEQSAGE